RGRRGRGGREPARGGAGGTAAASPVVRRAAFRSSSVRSRQDAAHPQSGWGRGPGENNVDLVQTAATSTPHPAPGGAQNPEPRRFIPQLAPLRTVLHRLGAPAACADGSERGVPCHAIVWIEVRSPENCLARATA